MNYIITISKIPNCVVIPDIMHDTKQVLVYTLYLSRMYSGIIQHHFSCSLL